MYYVLLYLCPVLNVRRPCVAALLLLSLLITAYKQSPYSLGWYSQHLTTLFTFSQTLWCALPCNSFKTRLNLPSRIQTVKLRFGSPPTECDVGIILRSIHLWDFLNLYFNTEMCIFASRNVALSMLLAILDIHIPAFLVASYFWSPCLSGPWEDTGRGAHSL